MNWDEAHLQGDLEAMQQARQEAIVRAALERAADEANKVSDQYDSHPDGDGTDFAIGAHDAAVAIRSLASDPAEVAAIISAATMCVPHGQLNKAGDGNKEQRDEEDRG